MGFSEDDRIRSKNVLSNAAVTRYEMYREKRYSNYDIYAIAEKAVLEDHSNRIMYEVLKIALREIEKDCSINDRVADPSL